MLSFYTKCFVRKDLGLIASARSASLATLLSQYRVHFRTPTQRTLRALRRLCCVAETASATVSSVGLAACNDTLGFRCIVRRYVFCTSLRLHSLMSPQEWTGQYWRKKTLQDLGLVVQLGHPGTTCHSPDNLLNLTVADSHGIHQVSTRFCACELSVTTNKRRQVLNAGWYPATVTNPHTCATIRVLEEFHLQNLKGGITVQAFVGALAKRTDATKVAPPPVSTCFSFYSCGVLTQPGRTLKNQCGACSASSRSSNASNAQAGATILRVSRLPRWVKLQFSAGRVPRKE